MPSNVSFQGEQLVVADANQRTRRPPPRQSIANMEFENFVTGLEAMESDNRSELSQEDTGKRENKVKLCCRTFLKLMLSQLGSLIMVVIYTVIGGFLFNYLEVGNEISGCFTSQRKYTERLYQVSNLVYTLSQGPNASEAQNSVFETLMNFASDVYALNVDPSTDCNSLKDGTTLPSWNVVNAAYFCITIITTIGYGHICPTTQWGQIVCIVYGILGIPLMLLFLAKIGQPTAMLFRMFYLNICCLKCFIKKMPNEGREARRQSDWVPNSIEDGSGRGPPIRMVEVQPDDESDYEDEDNEIVNIPITVTVLLLSLYIVLGAAVFKVWETWTIVEGAYFSFITLATIGFGDYVPGRYGPFNEPKIIVELTVGSIYCIFGLALLSMSINLIQDEISAKFHWIGTKLGISKSSSQDNEEEEADEQDEKQECDSTSSDSDEEDTDEEEEDQVEASHGSSAKKQQHPRGRGRSGETSA